jgi:hypothetical protein
MTQRLTRSPRCAPGQRDERTTDRPSLTALPTYSTEIERVIIRFLATS